MNRRTLVKSAAALGLSISSPRLFAQRPRGTLRGRVMCQGEPLADVRCSDGKRVVVSAKDGRFAIATPGDGGPFLFVVTPRGYWTDRFYVRAAEAFADEVVFDLKPTKPADRYSAIYMPDIHLGEHNEEMSYRRFADTIYEINALRDAPAFVLAGGDVPLQDEQGQLYVEIMSTLKMPARHAVGNRDLMVPKTNPRARFNALLGPTYYSFDYGHVHYVVLDGCRAEPAAQGFKNIIGQVSSTELAWLKNDLRMVPKPMPTVVAIHIPLMSTYPERCGMHPTRAPWWLVRNARDVIHLLSQFNVPLVLQGHLHENERIHHGPIEFAETVSICGNRWQSAEGVERGISGEPRGYRLIEVDGTRITHQYISSAESRIKGPGEFVGLIGDRLAEPNKLVMNFYDASDQAKVFGRIDTGQLMPWMPASVPGALPETIAAHHWKCPPHVLAPGKHGVEVRCVDTHREDATLTRRLHIG